MRLTRSSPHESLLPVFLVVWGACAACKSSWCVGENQPPPPACLYLESWRASVCGHQHQSLGKQAVARTPPPQYYTSQGDSPGRPGNMSPLSVQTWKGLDRCRYHELCTTRACLQQHGTPFRPSGRGYEYTPAPPRNCFWLSAGTKADDGRPCLHAARGCCKACLPDGATRAYAAETE